MGRPVAPGMTGAQLQEGVVEEAHLYGLYVAHFRPARILRGRQAADGEPEHGWRTPVAYDAEGWPDLSIAGTRLICREIKREDEAVTDAQAEWLRRLVAAGIDAKVWRPSDRRSGLITQELLAIRLPKVTAGR